ncbi:MAG TPA: response regulator [Longimicrobiales bacterium]
MEPAVRGSALVVEDDAATRSLISRHLGRTGLDVVAVGSGEEVLREAAGGTSFDVVVLDLHLPGMSGLDLASLIQARRPEQPIVLITGDPDPGLAREALARGPVKFLLKPFEMSALQAAVAQALTLAVRAERRSAPAGWLDLVERSYMGSVHARRVGRVALALAESIPGVERRLEIRDLLVAAWSHELGRTTAGEPVGIATEGARMLSELGSATNVVQAVRHLAERYDGTGGPRGCSGDAIPLISQIVSVADAVEHFVVESFLAGEDTVAAVDRALAAVTPQRGAAFRPEVVDAARRQRSRLITICADLTVESARQSTAAA